MWQVRQEKLSFLASWQLVGRIAITSDEESWQASIRWSQQGERYDIRLSGPLGQGAVVLKGDRYSVAMQTSDGELVTADDASELLYRYTGWRLPVDALRFWVLGLPAPGEPARTDLDAYGRLGSLEQGPWHVEYRRYGDRPGLDLPTKVFAKSARGSVRLVVDDWHTPTLPESAAVSLFLVQ